MPRKQATAIPAESSFSSEPLAVETPKAPAESAPSPDGDKAHAPEGEKSYGPDPRELMRVTLGASNADPKMTLLRSHKYRQMQIHSDVELSDRHKELLAKAGWRDRTEEEGIWTKQLPKEGEKWQAAADAERLFKQIANEVRADKGLGPVLGL